jgi:geranylgeranylglycerol-phosphate geranylgeranyltransferase
MSGGAVVVGRAPVVAPAALGSRRFLRDYLVTMRPYLMFVSGITGLAGLALAPPTPIANCLLLALAFFLSYGFGQALTDCFQLDTDSLSAPYRPLVRGAIRRRDVLWVSLIGLLAVAAVFAAHNPLNVPLAIVAVLGLATYTFFKRRWWAGPFYNAWIVVVLALVGYHAGAGRGQDQGGLSTVLAATLAAVFFGYANFVLTGYYKDISADRATGYRTLPVRFGLSISARISDVLALLTVASAAGAVCAGWRHGAATLEIVPAVLVLAAGTAVACIAQIRLHAVRDERQAHRAIAPVVHAYILLLAAVAAAQRPGWIVGLFLFYAAFVLTMRSRPMREQI